MARNRAPESHPALFAPQEAFGGPSRSGRMSQPSSMASIVSGALTTLHFYDSEEKTSERHRDHRVGRHQKKPPVEALEPTAADSDRLATCLLLRRVSAIFR